MSGKNTNQQTTYNLFQYGQCPSCEHIGYFLYGGIQEGYTSIPDLVLYHCPECRTTQNLERILIKIQETVQTQKGHIDRIVQYP